MRTHEGRFDQDVFCRSWQEVVPKESKSGFIDFGKGELKLTGRGPFSAFDDSTGPTFLTFSANTNQSQDFAPSQPIEYLVIQARVPPTVLPLAE